MKKLLKMTTVGILSTAPIATTVSCAIRDEETYLTDVLPVHSYFVDPKMQDNTRRAAFTMDNVYKDLITDLPPDLLSYGDRNYNMASGGWAEKRLFYSANNDIDSTHRQNFWHPAVDVLLPIGQPVIAPADGKIVGAFHVDWEIKTNLNGVGGNLLFVADVEDLDMPDDVRQEEFTDHGADQVAMVYMHLSNKSTLDIYGDQKAYEYDESNGHSSKSTVTYASEVDYDNPHYVKKGDVIGYIGDKTENTGWMPHLHLQVHKNKVNGVTPDIIDATTWDPGSGVGTYSSDYANAFMKMQDFKIVSEPNVPSESDPTSTEERDYRNYFYNLRGKGVWGDASSIHENGTESSTIYDQEYFLDLFDAIGYVDPNKIFHYQDETTPIFNVGDYLNE